MAAFAASPDDEEAAAQALAQRYRCDFLDLRSNHIQHDLLRRVPVELMFRFSFVPVEEFPDGSLAIAVADPSQLMII